MIRFSRRLLGLAALLALAGGCADSTGSDGAPSTVTARAYVDRDGNGAWSAGDVAIAGATIVLSPVEDGGPAQQATTGADGIATFTTVEPGAYALAFQGTPPAGAVLASATAPVVVAPFSGADAVSAEFRFAFEPGTITGRLFRDDDGDGAFDPAADSPAPAVRAFLFAGTTAGGDTLAMAVTDAQGAFSFGGLRPGTYTITFELPGSAQLVGGDAMVVTVGAAAPTVVPVQFTGTLSIPIALARMVERDSAVVVDGVVIVAQNTFRDDNVYIQDASGGIQVFGVDESLDLALGDSVRVDGVMGQFNGELQIVDPVVVVLGQGTVPAPLAVTGSQIVANGDEGELARIEDALVTRVGSASGSGSFSVTALAPDSTTFTIRVEGRTGLTPADFTAGSVYDVTGVLASFNGTGQIKPRGAGDISVSTVADARATAEGQPAAIVGVVTVAQGTFRNDNAYVQDATGGILVFGLDAALGLQVGDSVYVAGEIDIFNEELEIVDPVVTKLGTGAVPAPVVITGTQFASRADEGELARINNMTITSVGGGTGSSFNVDAQAPDGTAVVIRVEGNTGLTRADFTAGSTYDIIGVLSVFRGTPQLKPRGAADVIAR